MANAEFWWSHLEKAENLKARIEMAFGMEDLTDENNTKLTNALKRVNDSIALSKFQLGLPYK